MYIERTWVFITNLILKNHRHLSHFHAELQFRCYNYNIETEGNRTMAEQTPPPSVPAEKRQMTPEDLTVPAQERSLVRHKQSIKVHFDLAAIRNCYTEYSKAKPKDVSAFKGVKAKGSDLGDLDANCDAAKEIYKALEPREFTRKSYKNFQDTLDRLDSIQKDPKAEYDVYTILKVLYDQKGEAVRALNEIHDIEKKALGELFEDDAFKKNLRQEMKLADDAPLDNLKKDMLSKLEEEHKQNLDKIEKQMEQSIKKAHDEIQKKQDEIVFLASMYRSNKDWRRKIDQMYLENQGKNASAQVELTTDKDRFPSALFRDISLDDKQLEKLNTVSGRPLLRREKGTYVMQLPLAVTSKLYYLGMNTKMKGDFLSLAGVVRACGYKGIDFKISENGKELAVAMGRQAFLAAIEVGFDPKDIKVNVNGKLMKQEELFPEGDIAIEASLKIQKAVKETRKEPSLDSDDIKKKASELRQELRQGREQESSVTEDTDLQVSQPPTAGT